jgi:hypothetical protein
MTQDHETRITPQIETNYELQSLINPLLKNKIEKKINFKKEHNKMTRVNLN